MDQSTQKAKATLMLRNRKNIDFTKWLKNVSPQYDWDLPHLIKIREYLDRIINGENFLMDGGMHA